MASIPYMVNPVGPPWLPASVAEARKLAYWAQLIGGILAVLLFIIGIVTLVTGDRFSGILYVVEGIIALIFVIILKSMLFDILDQGKFKEASDRMLILGIIGLFAGVIPGILLILGYIRMQEVFQPQYQQYQPQNATVAPPQQGQQPAPQQTYSQPAPQYQQPAQQQDQMQTLREGIKQDQAQAEQKKKEQKTEMIKCSKCGVQYPSFMHACPNCNEPKSR